MSEQESDPPLASLHYIRPHGDGNALFTAYWDRAAKDSHWEGGGQGGSRGWRLQIQTSVSDGAEQKSHSALQPGLASSEACE